MQTVYNLWSKEVLNECINDWRKGNLPAIDLELTAKCSHGSCIYCDSGNKVGEAAPDELGSETTLNFLKEAISAGLKYVYTCGLGEPLEDPRFPGVIKFLSNNNVRVSIFTNGLFINRETAKLLHDCKVSVILKMDSFDEAVFDELLGKTGAAKSIYSALRFLLDVGYAKVNKLNTTDLAFSIVPTALNLNKLKDVIRYAKEHNIFPSIGELEFSGRSKEDVYKKLALSKEETKSLRSLTDVELWRGYKRPICPAILASLHIDNNGDCIVDKKTGLSCKWFLLKEPDYSVIGNIKKDDFKILLLRAKDYRASCFSDYEQIKHCAVDYEFGGCGGNPQNIIKLARQLYK